MSRSELAIPNYQRPYTWKERNVFALLEDIQTAIEMKDSYGEGFKYRVGTIILHHYIDENNNIVDDIVDGQQRTLTLLLLLAYLNIPNPKLSKWTFSNAESQKSIHANYKCIEDYFAAKDPGYKDKVKAALSDILEVVVISVEKLSEAFQLFDSQNHRGKPLEPHDLLKAYHLREMRDYPHEMFHAVEKWEDFERRKTPSVIRELFHSYLFPICHWTRNIKCHDFESTDIDIFKGISEFSQYGYARRVQKAMPFFQLAEPFVAGENFFDMVEHYLYMKEDIDTELSTNPNFSEINQIIHGYAPKDREDDQRGPIRFTGSGFAAAALLFKCVLFCYYDRFRNFDVQAVRKLFIWAYMLRVDMDHLGYSSIQKYAIGGEGNDSYTFKKAMFSLIKNSRLHSEISNIQLEIPDVISDNKRKIRESIKILHSLLKNFLRKEDY